MDPIYDRLVQTLSRYMSLILARSVVDGAVRRAGVGGRVLRPEHLPRVIPLLEAGTRLFVDAERQPELSSELAALDGPRARPGPAVIDVQTEPDIARARVTGREIAEQLGAATFTAQKVATVVSELARNIVKYTTGGWVEIAPLSGPHARLKIVAIDRGSGIPNLDQVMAGNYRSKTGLGSGLRGTKRLADRFEITTGNSGTRVEVEIAL
jgi:serine/threonine-protein kinase RsbT